LLLPAGTHDVQIDYTAPVPDTPERARFRYRLAGYDHAWQDAGARRQAFYTGLGPGRYRFEVEAAQGTSAWSAQPGSRLIDIAPAWYQTWWFRLLCTLALLALLAGAYRWRVQQLTRRVREQDAARQQERERIARELHDTVLQTNFALLLQVRAVAAAAAGDALGARLGAIVTQAQATLAEGRDKVAGLRAQQERRPAFSAAVAQLAHDIMADSGTDVVFAGSGQPWRFSDAVDAECLAIAAEAMTNVRKHARARTLRVTVRYRVLACDIIIDDDGCGIAPDLVGGRAGHWGLAGMRERAALVHARLNVRTAPSGTTVTLRLDRWRARQANKGEK
jgi:signal transduction histidine kinase